MIKFNHLKTSINMILFHYSVKEELKRYEKCRQIYKTVFFAARMRI